MSIKKIDLNIPISNIEETFKEALRLLQYTDKNWNEQEVQYKVYTEGFTNKLVGCYLKTNPNDVVLIRVNGEKTELFIDREKEMRIMNTMHQSGLSPPLYCAFNNGICYGFLPGRTIGYKEATNLEIAQKIAYEMAKMHTISLPHENANDANLFPFIEKFLESIPDSFSKPGQNERFKKYIGTKQTLLDEISYLETIVKAHKLEVVFSHNDLLFRNIIYNEDKNTIGFVDFEYGGNNYQPFDIGNHFCEFAGVEGYDPSLIPDEAFKKWWIRQYLDYWTTLKHLPKYTEAQLEEFAQIVDYFMLASHLLWVLWALVQAEYSLIDVDYLGFAIVRLKEYFRQKSTL